MEQDLSQLAEALNRINSFSKRVQQQLEEEKQALELEQKKLWAEKQEMAKRYKIDDTVIELNVSGRHFTTFKSTLCKYSGSMLEAMFSGRHPYTKDSSGRYFIDRPSEPFAVILSWLQTGVPLLPLGLEGMTYKGVRVELEYYGLGEAFEECLKSHRLMDSVIVNDDMAEQLVEWAGGETEKWSLLYRGSRDGFLASDFHSRCDAAKGPKLTIIKSADCFIFGGYAKSHWTGDGNGTPDYAAWLFTLSPTRQKGSCALQPGGSMYHYNESNYIIEGPSFGADLCISDNCDTNYSFATQQFFNITLPASSFLVREIEVFAQTV